MIWVDRAMVAAHINGGAAAGVSAPTLEPYVLAAEAYILDRRPDLAVVGQQFPADAQLAAALMVARLWDRRASAGGVIGFETGAAERVAASDPDVMRLLKIGVHAIPVVG